jgi:hypothetical protein
MAEMQARQRLDLQRQHRRALRFGKGANPLDGEHRIRPGLRIQRLHRRLALRQADLQGLRHDLVETPGELPHRRVAAFAHGGHDRPDDVLQRGATSGPGARWSLDEGHALLIHPAIPS